MIGVTFVIPVYVDAVAALGSVQSRLTKRLIQVEDKLSMPVHSANETVHIKLGLNLLKIIQLVCTHEL